MRFLKNHPFAVEAHFDSSLVLTFAVQKGELEKFIPTCLELDTFEDQWAFVAMAMVQTRNLRPKGFPKFMGNDFFLMGYRIFVRYTNNAGKRLRGLFIIKSETNKRKMQFFGNIFTHYNYTTTDIQIEQDAMRRTIKSDQSGLKINVNTSAKEVQLPNRSPFSNWKQARRYAGPLPHTFTVNERDKTILTILGWRQNWKPEPVQIEDYHIPFLDELKLDSMVLANAFEVTNIAYHWEKGKLEKWT